jgi:hypothetical protein
VLAVRDFLAALLAQVERGGRELVAAVASAGLATAMAGQPSAPASELVLAWEAAPPDRIELPIYEWKLVPSPVTGREEIRYRRGVVRAVEVPWVHGDRPAVTVPRPRGYLVLPGWPEIERRIADHGLRFERLERPLELEVETLRVANPEYAARPYQGRTRLEARVTRALERRSVPAGALYLPAAQPDFEVAAQLLEPEAPDSLLRWGFLSTVFEAKEWIDEAVLAPWMEKLVADPAVAAAWARALEDPTFAGDPAARWRWWFERTPYWDETVGLLPYFRLVGPLPGATSR